MKKSEILYSIPRGLVSRKQCTQALTLISLNALNAFLHNFLIIPFSHHALLDTHNPPLLICTPPSWCSKIHPFHTHDFTSSPKISQNKVDSQSWSPNTPINHLIVINRSEIIPPPQKAPSSIITPKNLPPFFTNLPFHTNPSTNTP